MRMIVLEVLATMSATFLENGLDLTTKPGEFLGKVSTFLVDTRQRTKEVQSCALSPESRLISWRGFLVSIQKRATTSQLFLATCQLLLATAESRRIFYESLLVTAKQSLVTAKSCHFLC